MWREPYHSSNCGDVNSDLVNVFLLSVLLLVVDLDFRLICTLVFGTAFWNG